MMTLLVAWSNNEEPQRLQIEYLGLSVGKYGSNISLPATKVQRIRRIEMGLNLLIPVVSPSIFATLHSIAANA